tara:strand:+ start:72 stop:329 length:258 start_codon:yes stop_codon:yes gene_type:complete
MSRRRVDGIKDKLTYKEGTSRQYQDQLRYKALGLCVRCQKPMWKGISKQFCEKHTLMVRESQRKRIGAKKRNKNCKSYVVKKEQK